MRLQWRLQRLGAMPEAAARLMARDRLGRDVFLRGAPEGLRIDPKSLWHSNDFAIIQPYGQFMACTAPRIYTARYWRVMTPHWPIIRVSALLCIPHANT